MEHESFDPFQEVPRRLPGGEEHDPRTRTVGIEFGQLTLVPPEGGSWTEWVITPGIEEAERDERPIDNRTACYIAAFLRNPTTPALRSLAMTGAVDLPGLQEEIVSVLYGQTDQVQSWIVRLGDYCLHREDRGPVENWRPDVDRQDRMEVERVRRERILAMFDDLFARVEPVQRVGNRGQPGRHGLVRHQDRPGGWIVSEGEPGVRRLWETDSDAELETAYVGIVNAQRQWIEERWGRAPTGSAPETDTDGRPDPPDDDPPAPSSAG